MSYEAGWNADVLCVERQSVHSVVAKRRELVSADEDGEECSGLTRSRDTDHGQRMLDSGIGSLEEFLESKSHTVAQISEHLDCASATVPSSTSVSLVAAGHTDSDFLGTSLGTLVDYSGTRNLIPQCHHQER